MAEDALPAGAVGVAGGTRGKFGAAAGATVGAGGAGNGVAIRGICLTGTLTSGNLGLPVLTLNSTCWPAGTSNPSGNANMALKDLPG